MSNTKYAMLRMVTAENNNKFYEMTYGGGTSFTVKYGRIESTATTRSYSISEWDTKYNEKVKKGYRDVTHTVTVVATKVPTQTLVDINDKAVSQFMNLMKKYTDGLVQKTYSVKAEAVTQQQVDDAQELIDEINKMDAKMVKTVNAKLVELYTIIPRYMSHVTYYLLPNIKLSIHLQSEQDNLDAMAGQVSLIKPVDKKAEKKSQTLLDKLGITMKECSGVPKEVQYLVKQNHGHKVKAIFEVDKAAENKVFDGWIDKQKNTDTRILIHGTRCTSVIPILEIGLKIRPAGNFQFSGKAYGDGNYFSEHMQKSLGYTGGDNDHVILVYEVHTGNPFTYDGWYRGNSFSLNYSELQKRGFDSTFVKAGHGLMNSEIIAYKEQQCRIKYILWMQ